MILSNWSGVPSPWNVVSAVPTSATCGVPGPVRTAHAARALTQMKDLGRGATVFFTWNSDLTGG